MFFRINECHFYIFQNVKIKFSMSQIFVYAVSILAFYNSFLFSFKLNIVNFSAQNSSISAFFKNQIQLMLVYWFRSKNYRVGFYDLIFVLNF